MFVYRVSRTKFSQDLSGEGARLFGGRWNHMLTPCVYTSESRALAVLEYTVNVNIEEIPRSLSIITYEIPEKAILELTIAQLPGNWRESPAPSSTKDHGTDLLIRAESPIIKIPSTVIPQEYNYLLNPKHKDSDNFRIIQVEDFVYDLRIKKL